MATVADVLKEKGNKVYVVSPTDTILDALKLMEDAQIGAVLVVEKESVVGIFSERDYARRGTLKGNSVNTPVNEVMTSEVYYVDPNRSIEACLAQMTDKHIRHLPVLKEGKLVGVISIGDVVKSLNSDQKELIQGLENFILGRQLQH
ncbi:MAG: CBS domain-containing protein [Anaerolineaceae bacterium]|nr:CBS domain-containing protein [Anaerolineaceae bacterium]